MPGGTKRPRSRWIKISLPLATLTLTILLLAGTATATTNDDQNPTTPTIATHDDATTTPWTTLTNHPNHPTDDAINTPNHALEPESDDDACTPHPPIVISEEEGPTGFILGHHPTTGEPIYRPGSGVTDGTGTTNDPYIIQGWCIERIRTLLTSQTSGIVLGGTSKHVIVQDTMIKGIDGTGLLISHASNVTVQESHIIDNMDGLQIRQAHNVTVANNTINDHWYPPTSNGKGVWVFQGSTNITVQNNTITNNEAEGIDLSFSAAENLIQGNTITNNGGHGIQVFSSPRNVIENNTIQENGWEGIRVGGASDEIVIKGNTVLNHTAFAPDGISVRTANNATVKDNLVDNTRSVHLSRVDNILVENNTITNSTHPGQGLAVWRSQGSLIQNNTVEHSNATGINIIHLNNATLANNTATHNAAEGFHMRTSHNVTVEHNTAQDNARDGIALRGVQNFTVHNNTVTHNDQTGIKIMDRIFNGTLFDVATHNHITHNNITHNGHNGTDPSQTTGIAVIGGHNNTLTHNNIENNHEAGLAHADQTNPLDARHNWWGCPDGPDDAACNPILTCQAEETGGIRQPFKFHDCQTTTDDDEVLYDPWLTAPNPLAGAKS